MSVSVKLTHNLLNKKKDIFVTVSVLTRVRFDAVSLLSMALSERFRGTNDTSAHSHWTFNFVFLNYHNDNGNAV